MAENAESLSQRIAEKTIRKLRNMNYGATPVNTSGKENAWDIEKIIITKEGRDLCDINCQTGTISYVNSFDRDTVNDILEIIKYIRWEDEVYRNAPYMEIEGLQKYKLLSQYHDVVLAACEVSTLDYNNQKVYQFNYVTWEKDKAKEGVHAGNYFGENYAAAREDFAKRSGLINPNKLFSETEMLTIYSGLVELHVIDELSFDQEQVIEAIKSKISSILPEVNEKMYQANPKNAENEKKFNTYEQNNEISDEYDYEQVE